MLYVNLSDGSALTMDLLTAEGRGRWELLSEDSEFHRAVRGVSLADRGSRADLPLPRRFRDLRYRAALILNDEAEPVAEVVSVEADGVYLVLKMYLNGRSGRFRVDLDKRGRSRFVPPPA